MFQRIFKWKWIISAVICFLLLYILPASFFEEYYSTGAFLWIRKLMDTTFGKLPFPSYYLFLLLLFVVVLQWFLHFFREKPQPVLQRLFKVLSFSAFMTVLFFILWGFNYGRLQFEQKLGLNIKPLTKQQLITETQSVIVKLAAVREVIQKDTNAIPQIVFINNIEQNSRDALNFSLQQFKYPYSTKIRGRFVLDDMFLIFGVGGQYLPFVGEGNVDDAVFYSRKPFYLMHEMAHGNGFTEESECNFLAYISCVRSGNLSLQYSGELNYLLYLLYDIKYREEEEYIKIKNALPSVIRKDLDALSLYQQQHAFKTAFIGDFINNTYLKILGIQEGIKNYDKMILLVYAWKYNK